MAARTLHTVKRLHAKRWGLLPLALAIAACSQTPNTGSQQVHSNVPKQPPLQLNSIPSPAAMRADVLVQGRLSTLQRLDMVKVGRQIPYTYSQGKISNSPGYEWWVSKHFALKSDLPEAKVRLYLELLEMSYPHYVELFGAEPANIDQQRIAVVYGKSRSSTRNAMLDDGFRRGVHKNAGGETMYYNRAGYSFPSSREQHQRYIVIHETMHAFHMALSGHSSWAPNWITEGLADSIASHVYYPKRQQLAVMVRDRAPMSYLVSGLKQFYEGGEPSIAAINDDPALKRGLNFFIIHFLLSDPERSQYFAWFRDQLMAANPHSEATLPTANKMLKAIFPDWPSLELAFQEYVKSQRSSFNIAYGPWEQDGNAYWIRVQEEAEQPRLDIEASPSGQLLKLRPQAMDFPAAPASALLNPGQFGVEIEFLAGQLNRGEVGIGLGRTLSEANQKYRQQYQGEADNSSDSYDALTIKEGRYLIFDGPQYQAFALSKPIRDSLQQQDKKAGAHLGLSIDTSGPALTLTVQTLSPTDQPLKQEFTVALEPEALKRIQQQGVSLLASGVSHRISPHFIRATVASNNTAASNPWQFEDMALLQRVFRACLADESTGCQLPLSNIFRQLPNAQQHTTASAELAQLAQEMLSGSKDAEVLTQLSGIRSTLRRHHGQSQLLLENPSNSPAIINSLIYSGTDSNNVAGSATQTTPLRTALNNRAVLPIQHEPNAEALTVKHQVQWQGKEFAIQAELAQPSFDGVYLHDSSQIDGRKLVSSIKLSGPYSGKTTGTLRLEVLPSDAVAEPVKTKDVTLAPYENQHHSLEFTLKAGYHGDIVVHSSAELEVDGEAIYLSQDQRLWAND